MNIIDPAIRVEVDLRNPGHFFGCCGLLELADRFFEGGAEGWFEEHAFAISCSGSLPELVERFAKTELLQVDIEDKTASPILVEIGKRSLRLDWWQDTRSGGKELKVWAGTMESLRIAKALQKALRDPRFSTPQLFDVGVIAYDVEDSDKKVEPFYFDARRAPNAHSRDVGFSANDLQLTTTASPAVELFTLIGLQRCLPIERKRRSRIYSYSTWPVPLPPMILPAAVTGEIAFPGSRTFQFENWYRTGQKKHKAFRPSVPAMKG